MKHKLEVKMEVGEADEQNEPTSLATTAPPDRAPPLAGPPLRRTTSCMSTWTASSGSTPTKGKASAPSELAEPDSRPSSSAQPDQKRRKVDVCQPKRCAKSEPADDDDNSDDGVECTALDGKECAGCLRVGGVDYSFYVPGEPFTWRYSKGRGSWCQDCHQAWRIQYKSLMSLALTERHLCRENNRLQFLKILVSYVSMKSEGMKHVGKPQLEARIKLLEHIFGLLGVPFPAASVHMIGEGIVRHILGQPVPIHAGEGQQSTSAAVLMPAVLPMRNAPNASTRFAHNPLQLGPLIPMRCADSLSLALTQPNGAPATAIGELKDEPEAQATSGEVGGGGAGPAGSMISRDKALQALEAKLQEFVTMVKGWAALFMDTRDEKDMKEKDLTAIQQKLIKFRMATAETPYSGMLVSRIDELGSILHAAKKLAKPYREYLKTARRSHLDKCLEPMNKLVPWCELKHVFVSHTVMLAWEKGSFFHLHQHGIGADGRDLVKQAAGHIASLVEKRYVVQAVNESDKAVLDEVSCMVCDAISAVLHNGLKAPVPESIREDEACDVWGVHKQDMLQQVHLYQVALVAIKHLHVDLVDLLAVLHEYEVVVRAALCQPAIHARSLRSSLTFLEQNPSASLIREGFKIAGVGMSLRADSDVLLAVGELDAQCDEEFKGLQSSMLTEGMPAASEDNRQITVSLDCVQLSGQGVDSQCFAMNNTTECLRNLLRLTKKWSTGRMQDEVVSVGVMVSQATSVAVCCNALANQTCAAKHLELYRTLQSSFPAGQADSYNWDGVAKAVGGMVVTSNAVEHALANFYSEILSMVGLKAIIAGLGLEGEVQELIDTIDQCEYEMELRGFIGQEAKQLADFFGCYRSTMAIGEPEIKVDEGDREDGDELPELGQHVVALVEGRRRSGSCFPSLQQPGLEVVFQDGQHVSHFDYTPCKELMDAFHAGRAPKAIAEKYLSEAFATAARKFADGISRLSTCLVCPAPQRRFAGAESAVGLVVRLWGIGEGMADCVELGKLVKPFATTSGDIDAACCDLSDVPHVKQADYLLKLAKLVYTMSDQADKIHVPYLRAEKDVDDPRNDGGWSLHTLSVAVAFLQHAMKVLDLVALATFIKEHEFELLIKVAPSGGGKPVVMINPKVLGILASLGELCHATWQPLQSEVEVQLGIFDCIIPISSPIAMVECVGQHWLPQFKKDMTTDVVQRIRNDTEKLQDSTPRWSHIVSSSKYNQTIAKRQLLGHPMRERIPAMMEELDSIVKSFRCFAQNIVLDASELAEVQAAEASLDNANEAMCVVAVISVVEEFGMTLKGQNLAKVLVADMRATIAGPLKAKFDKVLHASL